MMDLQYSLYSPLSAGFFCAACFYAEDFHSHLSHKKTPTIRPARTGESDDYGNIHLLGSSSSQTFPRINVML